MANSTRRLTAARLPALAAAMLLLASCGGLTPFSTLQEVEVAETRVPCLSPGPAQCYLVRREGSTEIEQFHGAIDNFDYQPGYRYRLQLERTRVEPLQDASSFRYRVRSVLRRTPSQQQDLLQRLAAAEALWLQARPDTYSMGLERICFCAPEGRGPVRVSAERYPGVPAMPHETALRHVYVSDGRAVPADMQWFFPTVQGLFSTLRMAIAAEAESIEVDFDAERGFPRRIFIDYDSRMADEEVGFVVHSISP
jgi:hypothetical protein